MALKLGPWSGSGDNHNGFVLFGLTPFPPTRYTAFMRNSDTPDEVISLYYDSRANLVARGIIASPRSAEPRPFPASDGFAPDPRG